MPYQFKAGCVIGKESVVAIAKNDKGKVVAFIALELFYANLIVNIV